ncbi:MAG TPA: DUF3040 domain-containing protein [Dermatophilaceae bacterium]|nr:DUF3040 domain-containing protein [Dermatophilaceae bacterium]
MPLSEHEQHLLEQMEQALYAEDPKFASQMQGASARARLRRRLMLGGAVVVVGLVLVVLAVTRETVWLGGLGFALMVAGAAYALTPPKVSRPKLGTVTAEGSVTARPAAPSPPSGKGGKPAKAPGSFMQRMEQRWERRRHDWQ